MGPWAHGPGTIFPLKEALGFVCSVQFLAMKVSLKVESQTKAFGGGSAKFNQPENWGQNQIIHERLEGGRREEMKARVWGRRRTDEGMEV